jgi:hypothetical protein
VDLALEGAGHLGPQESPGKAPVPPHLSFSGVPGTLRRAGRLLGRAAEGDARARRALARWMADLGTLEAALDDLHAAGAIAGPVRAACRALVADHDATVRAWAARRGADAGGR